MTNILVFIVCALSGLVVLIFTVWVLSQVATYGALLAKHRFYRDYGPKQGEIPNGDKG